MGMFLKMVLEQKLRYFQANWAVKCGGKLLADKEEKFLTSLPNINNNCTYEIISNKPNGLIGIRFLKFNLGDGESSKLLELHFENQFSSNTSELHISQFDHYWISSATFQTFQQTKTGVLRK